MSTRFCSAGHPVDDETALRCPYRGCRQPMDVNKPAPSENRGLASVRGLQIAIGVVVALLVLLGVTSYRMLSTGSPSYQAGKEVGPGLIGAAAMVNSNGFSESDVYDTCRDAAQSHLGSDADITWSGGSIPAEDYNAEHYYEGCLDGVSEMDEPEEYQEQSY